MVVVFEIYNKTAVNTLILRLRIGNQYFKMLKMRLLRGYSDGRTAEERLITSFERLKTS